MKIKKKVLVIIGVVLILLLSIGFGIFIMFLPKINLDEESVTISLNDSFTSGGFKATNVIGEDIKDKVIIDGEVDSTKVGAYEITYKVQDGPFTVIKKQIVNVVDRENPVITLDGDLEVNVCSADRYEEAGYHASDDYDGDITDKVTIIKSDEYITYSVSDSSNNTVEATRKLNIVDEKPSISLKGGNSTSVALNKSYEEPGATAKDDCDGDLTDKIEISGSVDTTKTGNYTITYKVSDSNGNSVEAKRVVNVYDPGSNSGVIYLTFDDGPGGYTEGILDILKKYDIKATFFVTNGGKDSVILREHNEGHTVGLHTATHNWNIYNSVEAYYNDLNIVRDRVKRITGIDSKYIRFPGGSSNTVSKSHSKGIMTTLTADVLEKGYKYFDWNEAVEDAGDCAKKSVSDKQACVLKFFKSELRKNKVNMVLLHDIKSYTAHALEDMVKYAIDQGYTFKPITDETAMIHQRVNN